MTKLYATWILVLFAAACGRVNRDNVDSQTHWLKACKSDSQCGEFSCLCGACSTECDSTQDCFSGTCGGSDDIPGGCSLPAGTRVCVGRPCSGGSCASESAAVVRSSGVRASEALEVPECPVPARTTGLPALFFNPQIESYDGTATVNQRTDNGSLVLVLNEAVGGLLELRFNQPLPDFLPLGRRVHALLRSGGSGSAVHRLIVLRDDDGALLLLAQGGDDRLYQDGLYTGSLGFSLELTMLCQSAESDGCFKNQVQADYSGTFKADDEVMLDGSSRATLHIGGVAFEVSFNSSSVDGGPPKADCSPDITPGRYLDVTILRSKAAF